MNVRIAHSETSIKLSHHERVLRAFDIVWLVSRAFNLRRHWPECVGRVIYIERAIDVLQGAVVRRPD